MEIVATKMLLFIYLPILIFLLYQGWKLGKLETICLALWWSSVYFLSLMWGFILTGVIIAVYFSCAQVREDEFRKGAYNDPKLARKLAKFDRLHNDDWHQRYTQKWGNDYHDNNL